MKKKILNIWEIENNFFFNSHPSRLKKIINHYEIFKKTIKIPGDIVECGVFKGNSLTRFTIFRDLLIGSKKKVYGFDVFGKFPNQKNSADNKFAQNHDKQIGIGINYSLIKKNFRNKKFRNFSLIKGPVEKTLKDFVFKNNRLNISFLHLDLDVYNPTYSAFELLFPRVSKGGVILIDDYGKVQGATKATNEYFSNNKIKLKIQSTKFDKKLKFVIK